MSKQIWKPGTLLNPVPVVMVTSKDGKKENIFTVAWTGTICSDPAMTYISVRKERYSYDIIKNSGKFCINLVNEELAYATDYCGVKSGKNENKFDVMHLETEKATNFDCPILKKSPVVLECEVTEIKELGSHDMFIADVVNVKADDKYLNGETGKFELSQANPLVYVHGGYFELGPKIGKLGWSVEKNRMRTKEKA